MSENKTCSKLHGLMHARDGNFSVATALLSFPLIVCAGLSIDMWNAYETKTRLDQVADSAALAAISTSSGVYANSSYSDGKVSWDREAQAFFNGNKQAAVDPRLQVAVTADVQRKDFTLSSAVRYTTTMPTVFMGLVGIGSVNISGQSTAEFNVGEYYDVHVLVDNSPSMGIGASQADVDIMQAKMGCAFACHDLSGSMNSLPKASKLGVKLRIDVVSTSVRKLADMISNTIGQKGLYRLGLYSLGDRADTSVANPLTQVQSLTHDMDAFKTAAASVKLMIMPFYNYNSYAVGYLNKSIQLLNDQIPAAGNGTGVNNPRQMLLLITDGVEDRLTNTAGCFGVFHYGRCTQPVDTAECKRLKSRGVVIAILHTVYLPITTNDNYITWVRPFAPKISTSLQECASPSMYEAVDFNSDMSKGLNELFKRATNMPRLTR